MIAVTTPTLEGAPIKRYYGIVSGETISGVNFFEASQTAINEMCQRAQAMGANAVVGVHVDYFTAGSDNGMLAAIATGTAVEV